MTSPTRTRSSSQLSKLKRNSGTTALLTGHDAIIPPEPSLTQRLTAWLTTNSSPTPFVTPSNPHSGAKRMKETGVRGSFPDPSISDVGYLGDLEDGEVESGRMRKKKYGKGKGKETKRQERGERNLSAGPRFIEDEARLEIVREMVCATPFENTSQTPNFPDPQKKSKGVQGKRKKRNVWNFFLGKCVFGDQDGIGQNPKEGQILVDECDDFLLVIVKDTERPDSKGTRNTTQQSTRTESQIEESQRRLAPLPIPHSKETNERIRKRPGLQIYIPSAPYSKKRSFSVSKQHRSSTSRSFGKLHNRQAFASDNRGSHSLSGKHFFQRRQTDTDIQEELQPAMEASVPKLPWLFPLSGPGTPFPAHPEETYPISEESYPQGSPKPRTSILKPILHPQIFQHIPPPFSLPKTHLTTEEDYFGLHTILANHEAQDLEATRREEVAKIEDILCALDGPPIHWDVFGASIPVGEKYLRALEEGMIDEASLISDVGGNEGEYLLTPVCSPAERSGNWAREGYGEMDGEMDGNEERVGENEDGEEYGEEKEEEDEYGVEYQSLSTRFLKEESLQFAMEQYLASQEPKELGGSYARLGEDPPSTQSSIYFHSPIQNSKSEVISPATSSPLILPNSLPARRTLIQPLLKPTPRNPNRQSPTILQSASRGPSSMRFPTSSSFENSIISTTCSSGPEKEWWYGTTTPPSSPPPIPSTWMEMPIPTSTLSPRLHIRGGLGYSPPSTPPTPSTESETPEETQALPLPPHQPNPHLHLRGGGPPTYRKKEKISLFSLSVPAPCPERGKALLDKQVGLGFYILGGAPGRSMTHREFHKQAKEKVAKQNALDAEKEEKRKKRCDAKDRIAELDKEKAQLAKEAGLGLANRVKDYLKSDPPLPVEKKRKGEKKEEKKAEEPVMSGANGEEASGDSGEGGGGGEASGGGSGEASGPGEDAAATAPETPEAPAAPEGEGEGGT